MSLRRRMMAEIRPYQKIGENLFVEWIDNVLLHSHTDERISSGYATTPYVEIINGYNYACNIPEMYTYGANRVLFFYDKDKNPVSRLDIQPVKGETKISIPDEVRYVRHSQYKMHKGFLLFYRIS